MRLMTPQLDQLAACQKISCNRHWDVYESRTAYYFEYSSAPGTTHWHHTQALGIHLHTLLQCASQSYAQMIIKQANGSMTMLFKWWVPVLAHTRAK